MSNESETTVKIWVLNPPSDHHRRLGKNWPFTHNTTGDVELRLCPSCGDGSPEFFQVQECKWLVIHLSDSNNEGAVCTLAPGKFVEIKMEDASIGPEAHLIIRIESLKEPFDCKLK